jgi:hypothetical protein
MDGVSISGCDLALHPKTILTSAFLYEYINHTANNKIFSPFLMGSAEFFEVLSLASSSDICGWVLHERKEV